MNKKEIEQHIGKMYNRFEQHQNKSYAASMEAYLKGKFSFFGIKTKERRTLAKHHNETLDLIESDFIYFVQICLEFPEREMHHYALDTMWQNKKKHTTESLKVSELFCKHKAWWDTVDTTNSFINHHIFKNDTLLLKQKVKEWQAHNNFWLRRLAIIAQLKLKDETNTNILSQAILVNLGSKEFFINKAIGWALREYGQINPEWVIDFCNKTQLAALSRREALRKII